MALKSHSVGQDCHAVMEFPNPGERQGELLLQLASSQLVGRGCHSVMEYPLHGCGTPHLGAGIGCHLSFPFHRVGQECQL